MDFLKVDKKIPGQNYVCLSFVSPSDDIYEKKETFYFHKFLKSFADKYKYDFREMFKDYCDFKKQYSERLQDDFNKIVNNKTNIRGMKVRGVFETIEEAQERARKLRETDEYFHIFVGQVGHWIPVDPDPDLLENQEYMEKELNDLVRKNQENQVLAKKYFEERKQQLVEDAMAQGKTITDAEVNEILNNEIQEVSDKPSEKIFTADNISN
jgi:hypothetical protein